MEEHIKAIMAELRPKDIVLGIKRISPGILIRTEAEDGSVEIHFLTIDYLGFAKNPEHDNFETTWSPEKY